MSLHIGSVVQYTSLTTGYVQRIRERDDDFARIRGTECLVAFEQKTPRGKRIVKNWIHVNNLTELPF